MIAFLQNLHPVIHALLATCFTWALTALGAAVVFTARDVSKRVLDTFSYHGRNNRFCGNDDA